MSKSFRDRPAWKTAKIKMKVDKNNKIILPRVVERICLKTDFYPFGKHLIAKLLKIIPREYIYGLKRIELRPRPNSDIGNPYGIYWLDEKIVILYSVPKGIWEYSNQLSQGWQDLFELHDARILKENESKIQVVWEKNVDLAYFIYKEVLLHELGHHYENQYKTKRKPH